MPFDVIIKSNQLDDVNDKRTGSKDEFNDLHNHKFRANFKDNWFLYSC